MLKSIWLYIVQHLFKRSTQTTSKEINDNDKFAKEYSDISDINFNAIFSNKLSNYVVNDSELNIVEENKRAEYLNKMAQSIWKKMKKIVSMSFGYGGVAIVPYVQGGKIYYSLIPQNRIIIDKVEGELITSATILAEVKTIKSNFQEKKYYRWTNYNVENNSITMTQRYTDKEGNSIPTPEFWNTIPETMTFSGVDRVLFGFIKSPINNRLADDNYGVPITYGCDKIIIEIKECLTQIQREYELKETFVGVDNTVFGKDKNGNPILPANGLWKMLDTEDANFFQVYDPAFRPYTERLEELFRRLEHMVGTSQGIISQLQTQNATATEIKKAMYDTFTITDAMRESIEKGFDDYFYACDVLCNVYNLTPSGEYTLSYNWSYGLLEDSQQEFSQMTTGFNLGVISKVELRQWIKPSETQEKAEEMIKKIEEEEPDVDDVMGGDK